MSVELLGRGGNWILRLRSREKTGVVELQKSMKPRNEIREKVQHGNKRSI